MNQVVPMNAGTQAVSEISRWTQDELQLITDTVAKGATVKELQLFLYRCRILDLDPLKPGQIYFIKYGSSPGTIVVGIEGFRARAERTGKLSGIKRGAIRDAKGVCNGAWAEVYRTDWQHPAREEVSLAEYNTGKGNWVKMPETMIKKVAEAAALRMAFPDQLGGVYAKEEMEQAENERARIVPDEPGPEDGDPNHNPGYRIPFGKYAKRSLEEVGPKALGDYVRYLEESAAKKGQPLSAMVQEFVEMASAYIAAFENSPIEPGADG